MNAWRELVHAFGHAVLRPLTRRQLGRARLRRLPEPFGESPVTPEKHHAHALLARMLTRACGGLEASPTASRLQKSRLQEEICLRSAAERDDTP